MLASVTGWRALMLLGAASGALGGCNPRATAPAADAGNIPPSAYAECDPAEPPEAGPLVYTATCSAPASATGPVTHCAEWSETADGDWTPFLESCLEDGGTITTVPCPDAGVSGACVLPAGCTTQTTLFYYGAASAASGRTACAASTGTFSP